MTQRLKFLLYPLILRFIVRLTVMTCRVQVVCEGGEEVLPDRPCPTGRLYAFWHGQLLFATFPFRGLGIHAIVSLSRDGEYLTRVLRAWGYRMIRGSTSRGALSLYRNTVERLREGERVGLAPDGPRGPYRKVNPGVVRMAASSGSPIIPLACAYSRRISLRSWDRFQIPLPFSRIMVVMGNPMKIAADTPKGRFAQLETELEKALNALSETAVSLCRRG